MGYQYFLSSVVSPPPFPASTFKKFFTDYDEAAFRKEFDFAMPDKDKEEEVVEVVVFADGAERTREATQRIRYSQWVEGGGGESGKFPNNLTDCSQN